MLLENKNVNVPELPIGEIVRTLSALFCSAVTAGVPLKSLPAPFLWGPFGVGKSEGIRQIAGNLGEGTGKRVVVTDVRLLLFSPVDLRGVPVAEDGFSAWLKPKIFDMDESEDCVNILFLDELSAAPQSVQAAAYQITLDRVVGEHRLPDNCIVIAAGNRITDRSVAFAMPKALCNRLLHFSVRSDAEGWLQWAYGHGIDPRVTGFIAFDNSRLYLTPEASDMAFPTPRSWTFVSRLLSTMNVDSPSRIHALIASAVGIDTAVAFEEFCDVYSSLPSVEDIFRGKCRDYPKSPQVLYALTASLATAVNERAPVSTEELENICAYAARFPADYAMSFFTDLKQTEGLLPRLMKVRSLQQWLARNRRSL